MFGCSLARANFSCVKLGIGTHYIERALSSAARTPLCPQMAGCGFSSARMRIRWCFTYLARVSITATRPCPPRTRHPCNRRSRGCKLRIFAKTDGLTLFICSYLNILVWMCSCLHAPTLFCPCGIYQSGTSTSVARWHVGGEFSMGERCSRHDDTSSVSKACSLAVSMLWHAPRRTQNHWNRRRRVVGKTGSDIHVATTWISVRFQGQLWRGVRSLCRCLLFAVCYKQIEASTSLEATSTHGTAQLLRKVVATEVLRDGSIDHFL